MSDASQKGIGPSSGDWGQATFGSAQLRQKLEICAEQLAAAERALSRAQFERNRAAINRARIAVDRLRERRAWIASRVGANVEL